MGTLLRWVQGLFGQPVVSSVALVEVTFSVWNEFGVSSVWSNVADS